MKIKLTTVAGFFEQSKPLLIESREIISMQSVGQTTAIRLSNGERFNVSQSFSTIIEMIEEKKAETTTEPQT